LRKPPTWESKARTGPGEPLHNAAGEDLAQAGSSVREAEVERATREHCRAEVDRAAGQHRLTEIPAVERDACEVEGVALPGVVVLER
jgi:hypothetical protein